jgi:hypothetical protein
MSLLSLLTVVLPWHACGHIEGLEVLGDPVANLPASLAFGALNHPATASTVVTTDGLALNILQQGVASLTLAPEVSKLPNVTTAGEWSTNLVRVAGVKQWALIDLDTFDAIGTPEGSLADTTASTAWSTNDRSFCSTAHDVFLGGHCLFGSTQTSRTYRGWPEHTRVRIRARVHYIDRWNGEAVTLYAGGTPVWSQAHAWCTGFLEQMCVKNGVDTCGKSTPDRLSVRAEATFDHTGPTLNIGFASSLPKGTDACQTSWGVDDVSVELL